VLDVVIERVAHCQYIPSVSFVSPHRVEIRGSAACEAAEPAIAFRARKDPKRLCDYSGMVIIGRLYRVRSRRARGRTKSASRAPYTTKLALTKGGRSRRPAIDHSTLVYNRAGVGIRETCPHPCQPRKAAGRASCRAARP